MHDLVYDYAVIRVIPRVEREEFINVGVILSCPEINYLDAAIEPDAERIKILFPRSDIEIIKKHLDSIKLICKGGQEAGPIGMLSKRERFIWLSAPRSTIIQPSPVHTGYCKDPAEALDKLMNKMVRQEKA